MWTRRGRLSPREHGEQCSGNRIVGPRSLAALAPNQPVKCGKIGSLPPLGKKLRGTLGCQLLGDGGRDELVDADTVLLGTPLDLRLDRTRQAKRIGALGLHVLLLRIVSAGVSTSMPNPAGTPPKSRRLNVTIAAA